MIFLTLPYHVSTTKTTSWAVFWTLYLAYFIQSSKQINRLVISFKIDIKNPKRRKLMKEYPHQLHQKKMISKRILPHISNKVKNEEPPSNRHWENEKFISTRTKRERHPALAIISKSIPIFYSSGKNKEIPNQTKMATDAKLPITQSKSKKLEFLKKGQWPPVHLTTARPGRPSQFSRNPT